MMVRDAEGRDIFTGYCSHKAFGLRRAYGLYRYGDFFVSLCLWRWRHRGRIFIYPAFAKQFFRRCGDAALPAVPYDHDIGYPDSRFNRVLNTVAYLVRVIMHIGWAMYMQVNVHIIDPAAAAYFGRRVHL